MLWLVRKGHFGKVKIRHNGLLDVRRQERYSPTVHLDKVFWMDPHFITEEHSDWFSDIWSLGMLCIQFLEGRCPHQGVHPLRALFHIVNKPSLQLEGDFSEEARDFIARCLLKKEYFLRPSVQELLRHPFIKNSGDRNELQTMF
jgi:serine/threonine protein kinase